VRPVSYILTALLLALVVTGTLPAPPLGDGGDYLVGFRLRVDASVVREAGGEVTRTFQLIPAVAARLSAEAAASLASKPQVAYVEVDAPAYACYMAGEVLPWGIERIAAPSAWEGAGTGAAGAGVTVALLDTGIDYSHPDLAACYAGGVDVINHDSDPRDDNGHGTHCAGIIAAADNGPNPGGKNAGYAVVGVAPAVRLYAVKVLGANGSGHYSDVIAGLEWARNSGLKVACLGMAGTLASQALKQACDACWAAGMVLLAPSGNDGTGLVGYPARYGNVLGVTATDEDNGHPSWSNFGQEVQLCAPGSNIMSTMPMQACYLTTAYNYRTQYDCLSGTSMATAHAAGVAALYWSQDPTASNFQIARRLRECAVGLTGGRDPYFGFGMVWAVPGKKAESSSLPAYSWSTQWTSAAFRPPAR